MSCFGTAWRLRRNAQARPQLQTLLPGPRQLSLVLGSSSPESRAARYPLPRPTRAQVGGSSWAHTRTGSPGRSRCRPLPHLPHFGHRGIVPRGAGSCAPEITAMFSLQTEIIQQLHKSPGRRGRGPAASPKCAHPNPTSVTQPPGAKPGRTQRREGEWLRSPES